MVYYLLYILLFSISLCQYFSRTRPEKNLSLVLYYFIVFFMIIIAGFRYETGGDWPGYEKAYNQFPDLPKGSEPLFSLVLFLSHLLGSYQYIFIICEVIRFILFMIIINKVLDFKYRSLFLLLYYSMYYLYYDFIIIRQAVASTIIAFGFLGKDKPNFKFYLLNVIIAAFFHYSALIMLFFYYPMVNMSKKKTTIIALFIVVAYFIGIDFIELCISFGLSLLPKMGIIQKLYAYTVQSDLATNRKITGQSLVYLMLFIGTIYLNLRKKNYYTKISYNGVMWFMFFYLGLPSMFALSNRLTTFFSIFMILSIINIINIYRKTIIIPCVILILTFCFYKGVYFNKPAYVSYNPYHFYLFHAITGNKTDGLQRLLEAGEVK